MILLSLSRNGLRLIPATLTLIRAEIAGSTQLARALDASIPPSWPPPLTDDTYDFTLRRLTDHPADILWGKSYILYDQAGLPPVLVGVLGCYGRPDNGSLEIGYSVLPTYQKKGYATDALRLFLDWVQTTGAVSRVAAHTLPGLTPSIRVLEKNGFALVGPGTQAGAILYERVL